MLTVTKFKVVVVLIVVLFCCRALSSKADCDKKLPLDHNGVKNVKTSRLQHIIEFKKRDGIPRAACDNKTEDNKTAHGVGNVTTTLGLHGLLHVRSQKAKEKIGTRREERPRAPGIIVLKHHDDAGNGTARVAHKLQVRKMAIDLLRKIVNEHFPGGKLTVEQKIKALKLLGKIMKLKSKNSKLDIKSAIDLLSRNTKPSDKKKIPKEVQKDKGGKEKDSKESDSDLYATIANGPDVPKLPPSITGKEMDHAHSHLMPVGLPSMDSFGNPSAGNGLKDNFHDVSSEYKNPYHDSKFGYGDMYSNGNDGVGGTSMMDDYSAYARSRMPHQLRRKIAYEQDRDYDNGDDESDDDDDDYDDDDDEEDDDDDDYADGDDNGNVDGARTRSHVDHQNVENDYDDDDDDDDDEHTHGFERKNNIAKLPKVTSQEKTKKHNKQHAQ